jgi:hypothetical protein
MKTYCSLFFILLAFTTNAQKTNYIIKHSGDTVFGDYIITNKLVQVVHSATKDTVNINSEDVWQAISNNKPKVVLRCILYGYTDNFETVMFPGYLDPVYDTTLLLKPIISVGKIKLFSAKDKRRVDYFFVQGINDSVPVQLLYNIGGQMPDKANWGTRNQRYQLTSYVTYFKIFADQLNEMAADCDSITEGDIKLLQYMESSIKAFIKKYNKKCSR